MAGKYVSTPAGAAAPSNPVFGNPDGLQGTWTQMFSDPARGWSAAWQHLLSGTPDALVAGSTQDFCEALAQNPLLASIDQMWNANPLREVVPIDWAGIAHALRIVGCVRWPTPAGPSRRPR